MTKLPRNIKPQQLIQVLIKAGFQRYKGRGSHIRFKHPDGRWTQVAVHPGPIPQGTLKKIIQQAGITIEDLQNK